VSAITTLIEAAPRYAALLRSQYWPPDMLESYRARQLARTLRAAAKIPFYAERLGSAPRVDDLQMFPALKRSDIEPLCQSVRSLYSPGTRFVEGRSSGTSGIAVSLLFDASHQRGRNAARARYLLTNGWNPLRRSIWFAGARLLTAPDPDHQAAEAQLIKWFAFWGVRFLPVSMPFSEQAEILAKHKTVSVYGFPSGIDGILQSLEESGMRLPSLQRVLCGGEVVDDSLRERARKIFGFDLRDNYGSTEAFLAFQCPAGSYHINAEHVLIEIVDEAGHEVAAGQMGKVLLTTLENYLMPLVRCEIGDYAIAAQGGCPCGRTLPRVARIIGRDTNLFRRPDGSLTSSWPLMSILREFPELKIFQIVQQSLIQIRLRYVADRPLADEIEARIQMRFRDYLGEVAGVSFEHVTDIERAPSGKFMVTISEVPR
jgi:phenylacetate-CoA ligase